MLNDVYSKVLNLAQKRNAPFILGVISFFEAIIFPIPPDTLLIPMSLAKRNKALYFAGITTFFSILGGGVGYLIGAVFWIGIGSKIIETMGYSEAYETFVDLYNKNGLIVVLVGALTPFPFKVVAILSGAVSFPFWFFILASTFSRGLRFYFIAIVIYVWGKKIDWFIRRYSGITFMVLVILMCGVYLIIK